MVLRLVSQCIGLDGYGLLGSVFDLKEWLLDASYNVFFLGMLLGSGCVWLSCSCSMLLGMDVSHV